jgi:hypothetical protein
LHWNRKLGNRCAEIDTLKVLSAVTDSSKRAEITAQEDCVLVGVGGNDVFVVTDDEDFQFSDYSNSNLPSGDSFIVQFAGSQGVGITTAPIQFGLNFPVSRGKRLLVKSASTQILCQLFVEPIPAE